MRIPCRLPFKWCSRQINTKASLPIGTRASFTPAVPKQQSTSLLQVRPSKAWKQIMPAPSRDTRVGLDSWPHAATHSGCRAKCSSDDIQGKMWPHRGPGQGEGGREQPSVPHWIGLGERKRTCPQIAYLSLQKSSQNS